MKKLWNERILVDSEWLLARDTGYEALSPGGLLVVEKNDINFTKDISPLFVAIVLEEKRENGLFGKGSPPKVFEVNPLIVWSIVRDKKEPKEAKGKISKRLWKKRKTREMMCALHPEVRESEEQVSDHVMDTLLNVHAIFFSKTWRKFL